ncbi:hypothetical protein WA026_003261 [Henosepilachna vigintioctopunctata]|uniref:Major facilitator superfamily (MFS) profile domain-containing protein n=1 Tax=Henosepilachna vigintioctopunctata TaxID=420089 RepID=A0AAW1TMF0_9CUCU
MENKDQSIRYRMFISVFLASSMMILNGLNMVWTSPFVKKLKSKEDTPLITPISEDESNWLVSISIIGGMVGCFLFGTLSQKFSRKFLLVLVNLPFIIFYIIMAFTRVLWLYFLGRFLGGVAVGGVLTLLPAYIAEISDPKIRGKLSVTIGVCRNIGILITYCTGPFMSFHSYHLCFLSLPIVLSILIFLFAMESPYYIFRSDPVQAEKLIRNIKGKHDVSEELKEIEISMNKHPKGNFMNALKSKSSKRSLMIGVGVTFFTQFSGFMIFISYAVFIFEAAGGSWTGETDTIIIGVIEVISAFFATTVTDFFQRRTQFMLSYVFAGLCHFTLGGYFVLQDRGVDLSAFGWVPLVSMAGYFMMYDLGMGILTQTVMGELFSPTIKGAAIAICQIVGTSVGFIITFTFKYMKEAIGNGESFWIFAGFCFAGAVFVYFFLVETKGRTLEEVQDEIDRS